jgi:dimethylhistidine N-methyltransferase
MLDTLTGLSDFVREVREGLTAPRKRLPPKFFYDQEGVRLFGDITQLPEYYLTRTELGLLREHASRIAATAGQGTALVEYGASDEMKALLLLQAEGAAFGYYVPIDVAGGALSAMQARLGQRLPGLCVVPMCADFTATLSLPAEIMRSPCLGFFPGSTIGNLEPEAARRFLRRARESLGRGAWLVLGADLRKDERLLLPAYNDAAGVTARFNLNVLARINREAEGDFDLANFEHRALWNAGESRIEMHIVSRRRQSVRVAGTVIGFAAGETIHTENSYKHTEGALMALGRAAGWSPLTTWTDSRGLYSLSLWRSGDD